MTEKENQKSHTPKLAPKGALKTNSNMQTKKSPSLARDLGEIIKRLNQKFERLQKLDNQYWTFVKDLV